MTWTQAVAAIWSSLEHNLGIACNSLARLQPFLHKYFPNLSLSLAKAKEPSPVIDNKSPGSAPHCWRPDTPQYSFRLHSLDPQDRNQHGHHIRVDSEYRVDLTPAGTSPRDGSMEAILQPDEPDKQSERDLSK